MWMKQLFRKLFCSPFLFAGKQVFHSGHKQQTDQGRRKAAVVQAEAAVHQGDGGDQQEVAQAQGKAQHPAVFVHHRGQAVGVAGTHQDALGGDEMHIGSA